MAIDLQKEICLQYLDIDWVSASGVQLAVLRLDAIHPLISGNKWFKLKYYLKAFQEGNYQTLITFGGAFSNHLHATAAACQALGIPCVGIVRGLHGKEKPTKTLMDCQSMGMKLAFISKAEYQQKSTTEYLDGLQKHYPKSFIIPEGGDGFLGLKGAEDIADLLSDKFNVIACAIGTGTTFSGVVNRLKPRQEALGFPVMKNGDYLKQKIATQTNNNQWRLITDFHFGGFAKTNPVLNEFISKMNSSYGLPLDHVYNAKMLYGMFELIKQNKVNDCNVLCIHTGGLQGTRT